MNQPTLIRFSLALLLGAAVLPSAVHAQDADPLEISDDRTAPVNTSDEDAGEATDITITSTGSITLDTAGPALVIDSSNTVTSAGTISISNVDNATGVEIQGGNTGGFTNSGTIRVVEDFDQANTDDDPATDTPFASGTGRRGILVSGASPFTGNITLEQASNILVEGNESFGVDLSNTPVGVALDGTLSNAGSVTLAGADGSAFRIAGGVTGDVSNTGTVIVTGEGSGAFDIDGDIDGGFFNAGRISNSALRFNERRPFNPATPFPRSALGIEDVRDAASAVAISGDVGRGIEFGQNIVTTENDDGTTTDTLAGVSSVQQNGQAPAILIDGEGTPIMIGTVAEITDPEADGFDADMLYAFINRGSLAANGIIDDFDATTLSVADATLDGGILNTGTMTATTFVGGAAPTIEGVDFGTGEARVIVLGDNAVAERLTNSGFIVATASEAADEIYFDRDNIPTPRAVSATAIDIGENASLESLVNEGVISVVISARQGTATVLRDASGTLTSIENLGAITAIGGNSDPDGTAETDFQLVALDLSANTSGVSITQRRAVDPDPDDGVDPVIPAIGGDILLGSGDDTITSTAGTIRGDIAFGAGDDVLSLAQTEYDGAITNEGGLSITATDGSTLSLRGTEAVSITSASFDETSVYAPTIDGQTGTASSLQASGAISFAAGSIINPRLNNLLAVDQGSTQFEIASASDLTVGDLELLNAADDGSFLFDTEFQQVGETLVVTVDLRNAEQLGLDVSQTGVQSSVFNATLQALQANGVLGNELANLDTAGEFYAAYNQLLPEFAAASRQFVLANTDGAVGAVGNHLDSARRSPDKPGGAWLQEFAYFADRSLAGLSEQYRGEGFGFAAGLDTALGPFHAVGVNVGFASTEIEDVVGVDQPLDVTTIQLGAYAGYQTGNLGIDAYVGGGFNSFDQNRRVVIGDFIGDTEGSWDGSHINASLRAGYDIALGERYWVRPVASLDYLRLSEDAYQESGPLGVALSVDRRESDLASVSGLLNFGMNFEGRRTWIRPSFRVGYRNEFLSDPVFTSYRFTSVEDALLATTESANFPSSGLLLGFSVAAGSGFSSVGFDFDSDIRDGFVRHTGRIVVRLLF